MTGPRDFSGREIIKVLTKHDFKIVGRAGSHVQLKCEHPENEQDVRHVTVPMHDSVSIGTLHDIATDSGAENFDSFCRWIDRNN